MTRKEVLLNIFNESFDKSIERNREFYAKPATARIEPFKIADGLYYVGDKKVCVHLIDTGDGLILIDSGYFNTAHLIIDSIWRLGFDPKDVKWIIHTHGHFDHFGSSEEFRIMYGTKLAISRADAESLRKAPHRSAIMKNLYPFANTPEFDYEIEDGEIFELGNVKIRCVLTPGHTDGVLSLFFDVTYNGKKYLAGMFGGAGVNSIKLPWIVYDERSVDCPKQMLSSIDKIWNEPVTIHLGNHPDNNKTLQKREQQLKEGGNPFIDGDSWHRFLSEVKDNIKKVIKDNEALSKEIKR